MAQHTCKFYHEKPVKKMRQVPAGILLTFYGLVVGQPGSQITVTQDDWDKYGSIRQVPSKRAAYMRELTRKAHQGVTRDERPKDHQSDAGKHGSPMSDATSAV